jgi:signal transduction histidine kinase
LLKKSEIATISLDFESKYVKLNVEDSGIGFESDELLSNAGGIRGLGIRGMIERAEMLEGNIQIISRPGIGTQIKVEIPITWQA